MIIIKSIKKIIEKIRLLFLNKFPSPNDIPEMVDALNPKAPWPIGWKYHHIYRYWRAQKYYHNKKVLDVGCGYGYGSFVLSNVSKKVVGIDISDEAIQIAKKRYSKSNIEFFLMDAEKMDFDDRFDIIVFFKAILER
jgi:2-polyprenyl-3-methyl-5-hydroxy-6-metoxy-1,4-benzoquinol methylase